MTLRAIPRIPDGLKRLLLGRRSVTVDGNTLDTTLQLMLTAQRVLRDWRKLVASDDVAVARHSCELLAGQLQRRSSTSATTDLSVPGAGRRRYPRGTTAPADSSAPLLVFYHGGGYVLGDIDTHDALCRVICRDAGVHVLSVDYRLAPEHKAPAAVDDAYAAYRWALDHAAELGADPHRVAVGGDSAGGNLAAAGVAAGPATRASGRRRCSCCSIRSPTFAARPVRGRCSPSGYFLTKREHGLVQRPLPRPGRSSTATDPRCRRCWPTTCPGCRRPWS